MTIHILGGGAVGLFFAAKLLGGNVPVRILRKTGKSCIDLKVTSISGEISRFQVLQDSIHSVSKIDNLLITTKAYDAVSAFKSVENKLSENSKVVIVCNGASKVLKDLGPIKQELFCGYLTHGVQREGLNEIRHTGDGSTVIGPVIGETDSWISIFNVAGLSLRTISSEELHRELAIKVGINSCINPIAALFGVKNGFVGTNATEIMHDIAKEVGQALDLDPQYLLNEAVSVANKTRENTNSMLNDILQGRRTEIDYINGWAVEMGSKKGVDMKLNRILVQFVKLLETRHSSPFKIS